MTIAYLDQPGMNMQVPRHAFDVARPLRQMRRARSRVQGRAWAAMITIIAHLVAVTAIVEGLRQANVLHSPAPIVTVQIAPEKKKPEQLPQSMAPTLIKPAMMTAPVPIFSVAPPDPMVAPSPATPAPPVSISSAKAVSSHAAVTWQGLLLARLQLAKHYPLSAQARRQQGVVLLHFTMDREGRVLTADIQKSSGYDVLDQETLALIQRAQPLPKPPPEVTGDPIALVVPVEFSLPKIRN